MPDYSSKISSLSKPVCVASEGASAPYNAEVRKAAEDVLSALKYGYTAVAAGGHDKFRDGSVEALFQSALATRPESVREKTQSIASSLVKASPEVRVSQFGRYGRLEAKELVGIGALRADEAIGAVKLSAAGLGVKTPTLRLLPVGLRVQGDNLVVPMTSLVNMDIAALKLSSDMEGAAEKRVDLAMKSGVMNRDALNELYGMDLGEAPEADAPEDLEGQSVLDKLCLEIRRVRCDDETNPEWWGSDEIAIGGTSVDEDGDTKKIPESYVGGGFDDGDSRYYNPYKNFHWFGVTEGKSWPKRYTITMLLAEQDNGGFGSILNELYKRVKDKVAEVIKGVVGSFLEQYLGSWIANAIADAVVWVVDKLFGWIISAFSDDVFPPATLTMNHAALGARWSRNGVWGYTDSGWMDAVFSGHGGRYRVQYRWRLYA